jgi:protein SCO1/2
MRATSITILVGLLGLTRVSMALAIDVASFTILSSTNNAQLEKHYSSVPNFSLVERSGKKITLADLRGRIWIADFIYTNCADTCPLQTADMAKLQERWMHEGDVELVSFSVDPGRDTPRVLAKYADRFKADPKRWLFLTGEREEIARLVEDGFRLAVAPATRGNNEIIIHSPRFVLVDRQGQIHGSYDNRDPKAMQRLKDEVAALLKDQWRARDVSSSASESSRSLPKTN